MPQSKRQIAILLKEKAKGAMPAMGRKPPQSKQQIAGLLGAQQADQTSGIVPRMPPAVTPPTFGTPGLGAARFNLRTTRGDSIPKPTKRGSR